MEKLQLLQFRWIIIYYHAMEECGKSIGETWYDSLDECKEAAKALDLDYCCGFLHPIESRVKPPSPPGFR